MHHLLTAIFEVAEEDSLRVGEKEEEEAKEKEGGNEGGEVGGKRGGEKTVLKNKKATQLMLQLRTFKTETIYYASKEVIIVE